MSEVSIDAADALREALAAMGHECSAWPLPRDFEGRLPFTRITLLSGTRSARVVDTFRLQLETWAETPAEAIAEANLVAAHVRDLEGGKMGGSQCYRASVPALPHDSHDPRHPELACAEAMAQVSTRAITKR